MEAAFAGSNHQFAGLLIAPVVGAVVGSQQTRLIFPTWLPGEAYRVA